MGSRYPVNITAETEAFGQTACKADSAVWDSSSNGDGCIIGVAIQGYVDNEDSDVAYYFYPGTEPDSFAFSPYTNDYFFSGAFINWMYTSDIEYEVPSGLASFWISTSGWADVSASVSFDTEGAEFEESTWAESMCIMQYEVDIDVDLYE